MMTSTHAGQCLVLISKSGSSQKVVRPSPPTDANKFVLSPTRSAMLCDFYLVAWVWEHKGRTSGCDVRFDLEPRSMGTLSFVACGASIRLLLVASSTSIWWRLCKAVIEQPVLRCACSQSSRACEPTRVSTRAGDLAPTERPFNVSSMEQRESWSRCTKLQ
jgi:hypothetical protein